MTLDESRSEELGLDVCMHACMNDLVVNMRQRVLSLCYNEYVQLWSSIIVTAKSIQRGLSNQIPNGILNVKL